MLSESFTFQSGKLKLATSHKLSIIETFVFLFIAFVVMYIDFSLKEAAIYWGNKYDN